MPDFKEKGKCVNILHGGLERFECTGGENWSKMSLSQRRILEAEEYAKSKGFCEFKVVLNRISAKKLVQSESTEVQLDVNFQSTEDTDDVEQVGGEYIDMSNLQKDDDCAPLKLSVFSPNI